MNIGLVEKLRILKKEGPISLISPSLLHKKKILLDYCGPNMVKPMHMNHLRTTIVGESLKRLLKFVGLNVISDIHYGDLGTQMGCLAVGLKAKQKNLSEGIALFKDNPEMIFELEKEVSLKAKSDPETHSEVRSEAIKFQEVHGEYALFRDEIVAIMSAYLEPTLKQLGVSFDQFYGESRYLLTINKVIELFASKGSLENQNGNLVVPLEADFTPLFLKGQDGFLAYSSIDMGALYDRIYNQKVDQVIYVMGERQKRHWQHIFAAWRKIGVPTEFIHKSLGRVLEKKDKPYKLDPHFGVTMKAFLSTVSGLSFPITKEKIPLEAEDTLPVLNQFMALAMIKLGDFFQPPEEDYIFDLASVFQKNPAITMVCQYLRLKNFLNQKNTQSGDDLDIEDQQQQDLAQLLLSFPGSLEQSVKALDLSPLCKHLLKIGDHWESLPDLANISPNGLILLEHSVDQAEDIFNIFALEPPKQIRIQLNGDSE